MKEKRLNRYPDSSVVDTAIRLSNNWAHDINHYLLHERIGYWRQRVCNEVLNQCIVHSTYQSLSLNSQLSHGIRRASFMKH